MSDSSMDDIRLDILSLTKSDDTGTTEEHIMEEEGDDEMEEEEDDLIIVQRSGSNTDADSDLVDGYESFGFLEGDDDGSSTCMGSRLTSSTSMIFTPSSFSSFLAGDPILQSLSSLQSGLRSHIQSWQETWDRLSFEERIDRSFRACSESNVDDETNTKWPEGIFHPAITAVAPCLETTTCSSTRTSIGRHVKRSFFPATDPTTTTSSTVMTRTTTKVELTRNKRNKRERHHSPHRIQVELAPLRPAGTVTEEEEADEALECTWGSSDDFYRYAVAGGKPGDNVPPPFPLQRV